MLQAVFRIPVFFRILIELIFLSPDLDPPEIRIRIRSEKSRSGSMKKKSKNVSTSRHFFYFIFSTLNTVLFGQASPKPHQKHHLDPVCLLMDWSRSGFLKSRSGSTKNPDPSGFGFETLVTRKVKGLMFLSIFHCRYSTRGRRKYILFFRKLKFFEICYKKK